MSINPITPVQNDLLPSAVSFALEQNSNKLLSEFLSSSNLGADIVFNQHNLNIGSKLVSDELDLSNAAVAFDSLAKTIGSDSNSFFSVAEVTDLSNTFTDLENLADTISTNFIGISSKQVHTYNSLASLANNPIKTSSSDSTGGTAFSSIEHALNADVGATINGMKEITKSALSNCIGCKELGTAIQVDEIA